MGGELSLPLPVLPSSNYCCITSYATDSLCLMYLGRTEVEAVRSAVLTNWPQGIQEEKYICAGEDSSNPSNYNCLKIKMHGNPFTMVKSRELSVLVRCLAAGVISTMHSCGWKCTVSSDLSQVSDKGAWFFKRETLMQNPYPVFSIGLSSTDKLQINDCPESIHDTIRSVCANVWVNGIQSEEKHGRTYEIKLNGNPWSYVNKVESCSARLMVKEIIQKLTGRQFDLHCNSNLTGTSDTLFFQYNQYLQGEAQFSIVSLNRMDRMRLIHLPEAVCHQVRDTVLHCWPGGIQDTKADQQCFELKLKGTPWHASGQSAAHSRRLISRVLEKLASCGWYCMTGIDMSRRANDKSVLLFRQGAPLNTQFLCISLNETDKVRFIDAPENVVAAGRRVVEQWPMGLNEPTSHYEGVTYEAKLKGRPWQTIYRGDGLYGRAMLLGLWGVLNQLGWRLVLSGDVSAKYVDQENGPDYPLDVHSWWFMHDHTMFSQMPGVAVKPQVTQPSSPPPSYDDVMNSGGYPTYPGYTEPK